MTARHNVVAGAAYSLPTRTGRSSGSSSSSRDLFDACRNGDLAQVIYIFELNNFKYRRIDLDKLMSK